MARGTAGAAAGRRRRTGVAVSLADCQPAWIPYFTVFAVAELLPRMVRGLRTVTEARALPAGLPVPGRRPFLASTIGLVAGKGLQMGGGFLFWVIAARAAPPLELALVAAVVSAVMLCTQLGQMGTGAGVIVSLGTGGNRTAVLDTAFSVVLIAGSPSRQPRCWWARSPAATSRQRRARSASRRCSSSPSLPAR